jgi:nitrite reductase/ring-hydroxylating ferredoxin subunit
MDFESLEGYQLKIAKSEIEDEMKQWERTKLSEDTLKEDDLWAVSVKGKDILLVKKNARIYALLNKCPHLECTLHYGTLEGFILKCPCHDWRFDIRSGEFIDAKDIKIESFEVRIKDGEIYLKV